MEFDQITRLFDIPRYQLEKFPQPICVGTKIDGKWVGHSTKEFLELCDQLSSGLLELGIKPGDKVAIISNNRPEYNVVDIGTLQIGIIDVPIYPTISENDYAYIFNDAEIKVAFVSDAEILEKVESIKEKVPSLKHVYTFNKIEGKQHWHEVLELAKSKGVRKDEIKTLGDAIKADDLATLIYTSGTTGLPKGVMLSHNNIVSNSKASKKRLPVTPGAKSLSFLPLCHIYERMIVYLYMMTGVQIHYAESMETIGDNLREVKPEVFTAVPRLLEKVYDKIIAKGNDLTGIKRGLFFWAVDLAEKYKLYGENGAWYEFKLSIARKLIFSKWKEALGGNTLAVASGSAALQPRLARVFLAAGIPVMEGYGLTETSPVCTVNCEDNKGVMIGSVGRPIDGVQVKIAEDGEILIKGPNVMLGYYKNPEATQAVIDEEGWFHTGDIGEIVSDNFLKITDRKKEIFKTSGGKYIAPQVMENKFKESNFIEQIIVVGENKKHPAALIVPAEPFVKDWCNIKNIPFQNMEELCKSERFVSRIQEEVTKYNASFGKWEQIKKFALIPEPFSIEGGELTPTLKLRRKPIHKKYEDIIEGLFGE
ncbi:MAG: AMP-dependent synthetase/ligase [Luteibaculaceae bacterium]